MSNLTGMLHLTNAIGMRISVDFENEQDIFAKMRAFGSHGWTPMEIPAGGFKLPLALHDTFDWSLIGAVPFTTDENEPGVLFGGQLYKRREFEKQDKGKKLPAAIKYSRGAKPTDDPAIVEDAGGDFKYVTLISFRGAGKPITRFQVPNAPKEQKPPERSASQPPQQPAQQPRELRGEQRADAIARGDLHPDNAPIGQDALQWIVDFAAQHGIDNAALFRAVYQVTHQRTRQLREVTVGEARSIAETLKKQAKGAA